MNKPLVVVASIASVALAACELLPTLAGVALVLLGVLPDAGFSDPSSDRYGRLGIAVAGESGGLASLLDAEQLEIEVAGQACDVEEVHEREGHSKGSFLVLVDDSGSTEVATPADCDGCPTDPTRQRVAAAQALARELLTQAPGWRVSLLDFGAGGSDGFEDARVVAPFSSEIDALVTAADGLGSFGGTPLWDATYEVLGSLDADVQQNFQTASDTDVGRGLVVVSDGQDTESSRSANEVIARAKALQIPVHVVGLGGAADTGDTARPGFSAVHVQELRRLAEETGGFYGSVDRPEELPELFRRIAASLIGGFQKVEVKVAEPPPAGTPVTGRVALKGTGLSVPFRFVSP